MAGLRMPGGQREVITVAASTTLTTQDVGKLITNRGAAGAVTLTLPDPTTCPGGDFLIASAANQNLIVSCTSLVVTDNSLTSTSVALQTASHKIGGLFLAISDGTAWQIGSLVFGTQTVTVA